jgi:hypothetical protein
MAVVGAAAPAEHSDVRKAPEQFGIVGAKFLRVAFIEISGIVELGKAQPRGIGSDSA